MKRCQHTDTAPSTYSAYPEGLRHLCHTSMPSFDNSHAPTQLSCWLRGCLMLQAVTVLSEGGPAEGGRVRMRREKRTGSAGGGWDFRDLSRLAAGQQRRFSPAGDSVRERQESTASVSYTEVLRLHNARGARSCA